MREALRLSGLSLTIAKARVLMSTPLLLNNREKPLSCQDTITNSPVSLPAGLPRSNTRGHSAGDFISRSNGDFISRSTGEILSPSVKTLSRQPPGLADPPAQVVQPAITGGYYLEYEATSPINLKPQAQKPFGRMCGSLALTAVDTGGNRLIKRIACGREWCPDCRDASHKRRISRLLPRMFEYDSMAYVVVTFGTDLRKLMYNPKTLTVVARKARRLLKTLGYTKIYTRWHFFGDKSTVYNPHLNIIVDGGWLPPDELETLKGKIRRALLPRSLLKIVKDDLVINYQFSRVPGRKVHWIKYVARATFLDESWNENLASSLYGFHNGCFAGSFTGQKKWRLQGKDKKYNCLVKINEGIHPLTGMPLTWKKKPIPWVLILMENPVEISGWWYTLPPIRPPPGGVE